MNSDNSIASFWYSHMLAEKAPKLLNGGTALLAADPVADAFHADAISDNTLSEASD